jgi:hypothetical protein
MKIFRILFDVLELQYAISRNSVVGGWRYRRWFNSARTEMFWKFMFVIYIRYIVLKIKAIEEYLSNT